MRTKQRVTSLELSRKLKELDVKQESIWYWYDGLSKVLVYNNGEDYKDVDRINKIANIYSAFTVAELGEMLPEHYLTFKDGLQWFGGVVRPNNKLKILDIDPSYIEVNQRAKTFLYLLENKPI